MRKLLNIFGNFNRAVLPRKKPLLADIYEDVNKLKNSELSDMHKVYYVGPEKDKENFRKDMQNWRNDFSKSFQMAKLKLGV